MAAEPVRRFRDDSAQLRQRDARLGESPEMATRDWFSGLSISIMARAIGGASVPADCRQERCFLLLQPGIWGKQKMFWCLRTRNSWKNINKHNLREMFYVSFLFWFIFQVLLMKTWHDRKNTTAWKSFQLLKCTQNAKQEPCTSENNNSVTKMRLTGHIKHKSLNSLKCRFVFGHPECVNWNIHCKIYCLNLALASTRKCHHSADWFCCVCSYCIRPKQVQHVIKSTTEFARAYGGNHGVIVGV